MKKKYFFSLGVIKYKIRQREGRQVGRQAGGREMARSFMLKIYHKWTD